MLQPGRLRTMQLCFSRAWYSCVCTSEWVGCPSAVQGFSLPLAVWPEGEIIYSLSGFTAEWALNLNDHNEFWEWRHYISSVSYCNTKEKWGSWEGEPWILKTSNKPNSKAFFLFSFLLFFSFSFWWMDEKYICVYGFCHGSVSPLAHAWPGGARTILCLELLSCSWRWQSSRVSSCPKAQLVSHSRVLPSQIVWALPEHQEPGSGEAPV